MMIIPFAVEIIISTQQGKYDCNNVFPLVLLFGEKGDVMFVIGPLVYKWLSSKCDYLNN